MKINLTTYLYQNFSFFNSWYSAVLILNPETVPSNRDLAAFYSFVHLKTAIIIILHGTFFTKISVFFGRHVANRHEAIFLWEGNLNYTIHRLNVWNTIFWWEVSKFCGAVQISNGPAIGNFRSTKTKIICLTIIKIRLTLLGQFYRLFVKRGCRNVSIAPTILEKRRK